METLKEPVAAETSLSLADGEKLLAFYETMLAAARGEDWDMLAEVERQAAAVRDAALARPAVETATDDAAALTDLLTRVQALDRDIRDIVEPAREEARQQLAAEVKGRAVRAAYGPGGGGAGS
ncbi:MAG: flagellar protein FliT [Azoarcus sp.]|jgi:flagellar protein FliT|nr:flagellar protein FliT [Azoarcus sp.]